MTQIVLVVDDDINVRDALAQTLELADYTPLTAGSFVAAKDHLTPDFTGAVVCDIRMPGRDGFHLLDYVQTVDDALPVVLLTGEGDIPMAVRAMGAGAFDFLEKPCAPADLTAVVERALRTRALVLENRRLKAQLTVGDPAARLIFGQSAQSHALRARVRVAAQAGTDVLVTGPRGSGISKVAEVIHLCSAQAKAPFVKRPAQGLTRGEVAETLARAQGGALFVDNIETLEMDAQYALLDGLERGGVRLIAGSLADLGQAASAQHLSADLFYRLEVMQVRIPALSERPEDIPVMFRQYVAQAAEQAGLPEPDVPPNVITGLLERDWPGNARALMSVAMQFVLGLTDPQPQAGAGLGLAEQLAQVERSLLAEALRQAGGQASAAARALKLPRKTFYDKLAKYGLKPEAFRS